MQNAHQYSAVIGHNKGEIFQFKATRHENQKIINRVNFFSIKYNKEDQIEDKSSPKRIYNSTFMQRRKKNIFKATIHQNQNFVYQIQ